MKTFSITTLGCKVNQYESQQIRELLEQLGLINLETPRNKPDLVIVNTCCVTLSASARSRQYIRKAQKLNPDAVIVAAGCLPTVQIGELNGLDENICIIRNRQTIATALGRIVKGQSENCNIIFRNDLAAKSELPDLTSFKGHTRAFLKVQDGCDGFCTYCIVPKTRPLVRSRLAEEVLREAKTLVEAGHKEIVVTGVFLGAYGRDTVRRKNWPCPQNDKLADLLDELAKIPNLARLRLSSLEPGDVTPRLLDTFCRHPNIMPHLHLSLQSGSNTILKKMSRQYNADEFRDKVRLIKDRLDRPAITTDIIAGFPGETEKDFEQTIDLAREVGFAKMHIFSFSARKGTAAANMPGKLSSKVIKERSKTLLDLNAELAKNFQQQFIGEETAVLVENTAEQPYGRSERYFKVYFEKDASPPRKKNELVKVRLIKNTEDGMLGTIDQNRPGGLVSSAKWIKSNDGFGL